MLGLLVSGCGRWSFDPSRDPGDGPASGSIDGSVEDMVDGASIDAASIDAASTITRVQFLSPGSGDAASQSAQMTLTQGNVVIVVPYWNDSQHTMAVADTTAQTWKPVPRQSVPSGCNSNRGTNLQMFYASITRSGPTTVTVTQLGGSNLMGILIVEYSGVSGDALDGSSGKAAQTASNRMTAGPITTTSTGVVVAAFHDSVGGGEMLPGPGFTAVARDTQAYSLLADLTAPAGTYEATANLPISVSDACWVASALALRTR